METSVKDPQVVAGTIANPHDCGKNSDMLSSTELCNFVAPPMVCPELVKLFE